MSSSYSTVFLLSLYSVHKVNNCILFSMDKTDTEHPEKGGLGKGDMTEKGSWGKGGMTEKGGWSKGGMTE